MAYRIELLFVGDAPESEMERALILADPKVQEAIEALRMTFKDVGWGHDMRVQTVRSTERKRKASVDLTPGPITFVPHRADAAE